MGKNTEKDFETHIEDYLLSHQYDKALPEQYNRTHCLLTETVISFVKATQPKEFEKLELQYGSNVAEKFCQNLSSEISRNGTLHVLRKGFTDRGAKFKFAYFQPSSGMNPEHQQLYAKNILTVVRQLKYSLKNENSIDMVLFLNGIPIITMELKNSLTGQFVEDAVKQYRNDRSPNELLLQFKRCLVHFAVGNEKVFMTTKLENGKTFFLPFNKGTENPVNPNGFQTAYLWEEILSKDTLLDIIQNYLHLQLITEKVYVEGKGIVDKNSEVFIFPRYHQLDAVRAILKGVKSEGVGQTYLVQHSAGSGKSNTIAWLSHALASLYQTDQDTTRIFDSIIVVTDRRILDKQLQNTIKQFEQTAGVVSKIDENSAQLKLALQTGKDIIITTLQKFPFIAKDMTELKGNKFAVIIDEAHSSQSGESSKHLKETLSANLEEAEAEDSKEFDYDDEVTSEMQMRGKQPNISYFAFTATPKNKTIELFGRKNKEGKIVPYHTYSMRQAIEEHFILDVLKHYTTFKRYFKLLKAAPEDKEVEKNKAIKELTSYVDLQPHAFETKTRIMLDHFIAKTINSIEGRGRAMVVTKSRLHAVRFQLMFEKVIKEKQLPFKSLIAFSGKVIDPDTNASYTEEGMNQLPPKVRIEDALKTPQYRILIAANKFQTGFDEPLLQTMYVDKKLGGVNAVQTLSRLNRVKIGKEDTVILDFVNDWEDIQKAFQDYYQVTYLEEESDPNKLYVLKTKLEQFEIYKPNHVKEYAQLFFNPKNTIEKLQPILDGVVVAFNAKPEAEREEFRSTLQGYIRFYGFISQLITFKDIDLEELYVFSKSLNKKLPKREISGKYKELQDSVDLDSFRVQETFNGYISLTKQDGGVKPIEAGVHKLVEKEYDFLSNIIKALNEAYGANLTEADKVDMATIREKLEVHEELREIDPLKNTEANIRYKFEKVVDDILLDFVNTKLDLYKKLSEQRVNEMLKRKWFTEYYNGLQR